MRDDDTKNLPADNHLQEDISAASSETPDEPADRFAPSQTNAGQQIAGLASTTPYGEDQDPDGTDANNPV
ncbi:hypothetical protein ACFRAU_15370 [Arthrobacter sp. NPDC056691]|uniref:hypothetical protein n=1 Tax=Arthrobacter sp. NPDC056691 TaxID=3345913 RepID=UPI00366EB995